MHKNLIMVQAGLLLARTC